MSLERRLRREAVKRRAREVHRLVQEVPAGTVPPTMLADFFKGIARQVAKLKFRGLPGIGGACIFQTLAAYQATRACDIDVTVGFGGLVARVGPDEKRDVVAFCGPYNMGFILPNGYAAFHCWIRYQDWSSIPVSASGTPPTAVACEQQTLGTALAPVQWTVTLPSYWLKPAAELELVWRPEGTPALGEAWYVPFRGDPEVIMRRIRSVHEDVGRQIAGGLSRIFNAYCDQHGIDRQREDRVYPLEFRVRVAHS
jgi:hypothetical protein